MDDASAPQQSQVDCCLQFPTFPEVATFLLLCHCCATAALLNRYRKLVYCCSVGSFLLSAIAIVLTYVADTDVTALRQPVYCCFLFLIYKLFPLCCLLQLMPAPLHPYRKPVDCHLLKVFPFVLLADVSAWPPLTPQHHSIQLIVVFPFSMSTKTICCCG